MIYKKIVGVSSFLGRKPTDEYGYLSISKDKFDAIKCDALRTAMAESLMRYSGGRIQFDEFDANENIMPKPCSYVKSDKFKKFIISQQYKDYKSMCDDPDFKKNGINSAIFKAFEGKHMLPNCEKQAAESGSGTEAKNINDLTASGSSEGEGESSAGADVGQGQDQISIL